MSKDNDRIRAAYLIHLALNKLIEDKIDFSKYDLDGDGVIGGLIMLYAGKGESMKNSPQQSSNMATF